MGEVCADVTGAVCVDVTGALCVDVTRAVCVDICQSILNLKKLMLLTSYHLFFLKRQCDGGCYFLKILMEATCSVISLATIKITCQIFAH
jgi:hypothetical protein